jgi:hypothetical protein
VTDTRTPLLGRCDLCRSKVWQRANGSERYRSGADHHHRKRYTIAAEVVELGNDRDWHWVAPGFNRSWG